MKLKDIRVTCRNYPGITFAIHTLSNDVAFIHPVNENWGTWVNVNTLELVTPVEELEPYHINEIFDIDDGKLIGYEVAHGDTRESIFYGGETHLRSIEKAKEAAEAERKRLIRAALEAYETEKLVAQASAYERGFCAGRRINNTTKIQHT